MINANTVKDYVKFLAKHSLTPNQFLLLYLLHVKDFESVFRHNHAGTGWTKDELDDLVDREFITSAAYDKYRDLSADSFKVLPKFTDVFFKASKEAAKEFYSSYPNYIYIDGKRFSTKACSYDEFIKEYDKTIGQDKLEHDRVMKALVISIENGLINMGIDKWFKSRQWNVVLAEEQLKANIQIEGGTEY